MIRQIILDEKENLQSEYDFKFRTDLSKLMRIGEFFKNEKHLKNPELVKQYGETIFNDCKMLLDYNSEFSVKAK